MDHGIFHIQCQAEDCTIAYVSREMLVTNTEVSRSGRSRVEGQAQSVAPVSFHVRLCCSVTGWSESQCPTCVALPFTIAKRERQPWGLPIRRCVDKQTRPSCVVVFNLKKGGHFGQMPLWDESERHAK